LKKCLEVTMTMYLIQSELKAPKGQYNSFGKYNYRSCEDIVEAVKPILAKYKYHLTMSDEVVCAGNRVYIKATCRVMEADKVIAESTALAREAEAKKGMDDSQITGTASSYARKYALNGLFAIDDTKDADTYEPTNQQAKTVQSKPLPLSPEELAKAIKTMATINNMESLKGLFSGSYTRGSDMQKQALKQAYDLQKNKLEGNENVN
jgi:hypothetical protein